MNFPSLNCDQGTCFLWVSSEFTLARIDVTCPLGFLWISLCQLQFLFCTVCYNVFMFWDDFKLLGVVINSIYCSNHIRFWKLKREVSKCKVLHKQIRGILHKYQYFTCEALQVGSTIHAEVDNIAKRQQWAALFMWKLITLPNVSSGQLAVTQLLAYIIRENSPQQRN